MNIVAWLILTVLLLQTLFAWYLLYQSIKFKARFKAFFTQYDPDKPSEFGLIVDGISQSIGNKVKTAFMGLLSGVSRTEKAAESELVQAGLEQANPIFGLLSSFPKLKKLVTRHPEIAQMVGEKLGNLGQGKAAPSNGNSSAYNPNKYGG
jgi:hypothetical protein